MAKIGTTRPDPTPSPGARKPSEGVQGLVCVCVEVRGAKDEVVFFSNVRYLLFVVRCNFCDLEDGPLYVVHIVRHTIHHMIASLATATHGSPFILPMVVERSNT